MIPHTTHRLLSRGDLPDSGGGLYNPGAWQDPSTGFIHALIRREVDYTWTQPCYATPIQVLQPDLPAYDSDQLALTPIGHAPTERLEDLRPFVWQDQVLVSHVAYTPRSGGAVRQRISRLEGDQLVRWDDWLLPQPLAPIEKNWALLHANDALTMIYSLSPLWIYAKHWRSGEWQMKVAAPNDWAKDLGKPPRNSTHLLPWRDGYLGFWHTQFDRSYVTGAYWLDQQLRLRRRTGILFDGQDVQVDADPTLYKSGVRYISSYVDRGADLWIFAGVGDAHSEVIVVGADEVDRRLR